MVFWGRSDSHLHMKNMVKAVFFSLPDNQMMDEIKKKAPHSKSDPMLWYDTHTHSYVHKLKIKSL